MINPFDELERKARSLAYDFKIEMGNLGVPVEIEVSRIRTGVEVRMVVAEQPTERNIEIVQPIVLPVEDKPTRTKAAG